MLLPLLLRIVLFLSVLQLPLACGELFCGSVCNLVVLDLCTYSCIAVASGNAVAASSAAAAAASSASYGVALAISVASFARFANVAMALCGFGMLCCLRMFGLCHHVCFSFC